MCSYLFCGAIMPIAGATGVLFGTTMPAPPAAGMAMGALDWGALFGSLILRQL